MAGRIECSYLAYKPPNGRTSYLEVLVGHVSLKDIDQDAIDEIVVLEQLPWGMDCSGSMASLPHRPRIYHLDANAEKLRDVSRNYTVYVVDFLKNLTEKYSDYQETAGSGGHGECEGVWLALLKETYRTAWYWLLLAGVLVSFVTFTMGKVKSQKWVWIGRFIGVIMLAVTIAIAFYSLGDLGWHCIGFCEFWSALEIVPGFRVHLPVLEILSLILSLYEGFDLLTS